jgi:hypothetical protein
MSWTWQKKQANLLTNDSVCLALEGGTVRRGRRWTLINTIYTNKYIVYGIK